VNTCRPRTSQNGIPGNRRSRIVAPLLFGTTLIGFMSSNGVETRQVSASTTRAGWFYGLGNATDLRLILDDIAMRQRRKLRSGKIDMSHALSPYIVV
jgi:hypothetical protein